MTQHTTYLALMPFPSHTTVSIFNRHVLLSTSVYIHYKTTLYYSSGSTHALDPLLSNGLLVFYCTLLTCAHIIRSLFSESHCTILSCNNDSSRSATTCARILLRFHIRARSQMSEAIHRWTV